VIVAGAKKRLLRGGFVSETEGGELAAETMTLPFCSGWNEAPGVFMEFTEIMKSSGIGKGEGEVLDGLSMDLPKDAEARRPLSHVGDLRHWSK